MASDFERTRERIWRIVRPTARRIVTRDDGTDGATGSCECGRCGRAISYVYLFCPWCGAELVDDA